MPRLTSLEVLATALLGLAIPATPTTFDYTGISVPGISAPQVSGINNSGQIAGSGGAGEVSKGFILTGTSVTTIFRSGSSGTQVFGINDAAQVVGTYIGGMRPGRNALTGFANALQPVIVPGADSTPEANGINNQGQIVGDSITGGVTSGFLDDSGKFTTLSYPGSSGTQALGINDIGEIVGTYVDSAGVQHAYFYKSGLYTAIEIPGNIGDSHATGINGAGQIVGYFDSKEGTQGFLDDNGAFSILNYPGVDITHVFGINNAGQIVGTYEDSASRLFSFQAAPAVPEPSTAALVGVSLLLAGLGAIRIARARRRQA